MMINNLRQVLVVSMLLAVSYLITVTEADQQQLYEQRLANQQLLVSSRATHSQVKRQANEQMNIDLPIESQIKSIFWPMVSVDRNANASKVDVHVPIVFNMKKDENPNASKLDLSVMSGLVTVNHDKIRQANGTLTGPMTVTVFGIPVYSGLRTKNTLNREYSPLNSPLESITNRLGSISPQELVDNFTRLNERLFNSVVDKLNDVVKTVWVQLAPHTTHTGQPLENSEKLVGKPKFLESDFIPTIPRDVSTQKIGR